MCVEKNRLGKSKTRMVNLLANTTNGVKFIVHNPSINNGEKAILERVFLVKGPNGSFVRPPVCQDQALVRLYPFRQTMRKFSAATAPYSRQEFVDCYKGRRHTIYSNALASLKTRPLEKRDSYIRAFVKAEKINSLAKSNPAPRIIQPRSPRFNVEVGRYIRRVEKAIFRAITKTFGSPSNTPIVAKGFNALSLGKIMATKWDIFRHPVAVGLDASRFDQHCGSKILKWEHQHYLDYFTLPKERRRLRRLLNQQLRNKGTMFCEDGKISYTVTGCRMSGDMNTALGNCVIMCGLVYTYMREHGLHGKYEFINNGDDCVIILEQRDLHVISDVAQWFHEFGYTMKVEPPVQVFERLEFCQTQPVFDGKNYVMCRQPHTVMTKDFTTIKNVSTEGGWKFQCQAISDCGTAAYGNIPVLGAMYNLLNVGGRRSKKFTELSGGLQYMSKDMNNKYTKPHYLSRASFFLAFGITPDRQEGIEEWYDNQKLQYDPGPLVSITQHSELPIERLSSTPEPPNTQHTTSTTQ